MADQKSLLDFLNIRKSEPTYPPSAGSRATIPFDGSDYIPEEDDIRLSKEYTRIFNLMSDGNVRTLQQIQTETYRIKLAETQGRMEMVPPEPESSISAQLRHMRKKRFGAHTVNKNCLGNGLWQYQLQVDKSPDQQESVPQFWTLTTLKKRGWTKPLISQLLGEASYLEENPHATFGAPMQLYYTNKVLAAEHSEIFWGYQEQRKQKQSGGS